MYINFFFYKLLILDYIIALSIIIKVLINNKNHQNIEKKILYIFIWILIGLPVFTVFLVKINFFFNNIYIFLFFLITNTVTIYMYIEKIQNLLKIKKNTNYCVNSEINFYLSIFYFFYLFIHIFLFF